jgi:inward rectifier potassium channel
VKHGPPIRPPRFPVLRGVRAARARQALRDTRNDLYHVLLTSNWAVFFGLLAFAYTVFNLVFADLYRLQDGSIFNAKPDSFADAFFFSVQTMATIGYGDMHPATFYANLLVTVEVLLGMTGFALATGLIFARFSRPTARIVFSRDAVITDHDGRKVLMFRAANQRRNRILEAQASLMLVRNEWIAEGEVMRRFYDLKMLRSRNPAFALTWTVMHPIDADSPLKNATPESLKETEADIVATLFGVDESFAQTVYARHSYDAGHLHWGARFVDIIGRTPEGRITIDYEKFHDIKKEGDG